MSTDTVLPELTPTAALSVETVQSVHHWNEHLFSFAISRPDSFRFRSGEFVMIGLQGDNGKPLLRAYSVASPSYDEKLDFLSIKVEDGPLTSKLQKVQPGRPYLSGPQAHRHAGRRCAAARQAAVHAVDRHGPGPLPVGRARSGHL
ncbi:hypothetical protein QE385_001776 [Sphingomonas sp. SORGH_AS 950]|nr:hypothetical protein [Sphingomonas sp. SORGH_AS_0950]